MDRFSEEPLQQLKAVLGRHVHEFDDPDSLLFMAAVREHGLVSDDEWRQVMDWVEDAMKTLRDAEAELEDHWDAEGDPVDADSRNSDWLRSVRARRYSGYHLPGWSSVWLWWIGDAPEGRKDSKWWRQIGEVAKSLGLPRCNERPGH